MFTDFILNGQAHGQVGANLAEVRYDPGMLRPYFNSKGERVVTINTGRTQWDDKAKRHVPVMQTVKIADLMNRGIYSPVFNATTLRKEEWIQFDQAIMRSARTRLRAWADLMGTSSFGGFNAMSKMTLEYEAMSDPGEALVDMDGLSAGRTDNPLYLLRSLPLPITHSDFWFSQRRLAISRNTGTPLDTTMAEAAARRIAEKIENTLIGVETGVTYGTQSTGVTAHDGTSTVYGYINYPDRLTKTDLTVPTGANPNDTIEDVLEMREQLYNAGFYGPFMVYHSTDWDQFLDNDYAFTNGTSWATSPNMTLRERIKKIEGISDVRRLDSLTASNSHAFTLIMVQMTPEVVRAIDGMSLTTVQWESQGGMRINFKVMCIQVPQIRSDYNGNCGLLHARTA